MTDLVPNEPAPIQPPNGAGTMPLDPDQSGVSQAAFPDLDEAEHAALLATAGGVTVHQVLVLAASQIGTGENPSNVNKFTRWFYGNGTSAAWCWIFLCWLFGQLGALALIFGKNAYVPYFRSVFAPHGEFHTSNPSAGDLVAFNFGSGVPVHIGIVEKVISSSVIQTIEGNTSDHVMRRTRSRSYVYGYATPKYGTASNPTGPTGWMEKVMKELSTLKQGSTGYDVWTLQGLLNARADGKQKLLGIDGGFGAGTEARVKQEQTQHGLADDGVVGPHTWSVLITGKDVA